MSHPHHHGHTHGADFGGEDWDALQGSPVKRILYGAVAIAAVATLVGLLVWWPRGDVKLHKEELGFGHRVNATVVDSEVLPCSYQPKEDCRALTIRISEGGAEGTESQLEYNLADQTPASRLQAGAKIVVADAGADTPAGSRFSFLDIQRSSGLWMLAIVFALAVILLGRWRGLLALAGIAVSGVVLLVYVFPALLHGVSPLGVALTGASIIAFAVLYLAHGVNERTTVALLGTLAALLLTAGLASIFADAVHLSGLGSEESINLLTFAPDLDFRGLMLAAVIIGALGVLDDVTITQVSAIWELHHSDPDASGRELYARGIRIGRDHIASTVNTLVLAYSAAALPLLLLFTQSGLGLGDVMTTETVAVEIVQTLVGSIGLMASVPLTTALAAWAVSRTAADDRDRRATLRQHVVASPRATPTPPHDPWRAREPLPDRGGLQQW